MAQQAIGESESSKRIDLGSGGDAIEFLLRIPRPAKAFPLPEYDNVTNIDLVVDPVFIVGGSLPIHISTSFADYQSKFDYKAGHMLIAYTFRLKGGTLEPSDWDKLTGTLGEVQRNVQGGMTIDRRTHETGNPTPQLTRLFRTAQEAGARKDYAAEQRALEELTRLDPASRAWNELGLAHLNQNYRDEAERAFLKQIELNPLDPYAHNNLGRVYRIKGRLPEAIAEFRKEIQIVSKDRFAHANLASALLAQRDWREAGKEAALAVEIDSSNSGAWIALAQSQARTGQASEASKSFDRALQSSDNTMVQNEVAYSMAETGLDLGKAWQLSTSAITVTLATICNPLKLEADTRCTNQFSRLGAFLDTAGWILFKQGKLEQAEPYVESSFAIRRKSSEVAAHLVQIYLGLGKTEQAVATFVSIRNAAVTKSFDLEAAEKQIAAKLGGGAQLTSRLEAAPKKSETSYRALVNEEGEILETDPPSEPSARPKLPPLRWPGHELRSIRTVEF